MSLLLSGVAAQAVKVKPLEIEVISPSPAVASINFYRNGTASTNFESYNWYTAPLLNAGDSYEIRADIATLPSNTFSGALAAWLPLTSTNGWSLSTVSGADIGALQISIRNVGGANALSSAIVLFNVEVIS